MAGDLFCDILPQQTTLARSGKKALCQRRVHNVATEIRTYQANHLRNEGCSPLEHVLIEYTVNGRTPALKHALYTTGDFQEHKQYFTKDGTVTGDNWTNLRGIIAERIARRVMKHFLKHYSPDLRMGDLFCGDIPKKKEYIIRHNDKYVFKFEKYPNTVILQHTGRGKFGYEPRAEIDGLFHCVYKREGGEKQDVIIVLESKVADLKVDAGHLSKDVFGPLRELLPKVQFFYALFGQKGRLFTGTPRLNQLGHATTEIHEKLLDYGIPSFFFPFNESKTELNKITQHVIRQYMGAHIMQRRAQKQVHFQGNVTLRPNGVDIRDGDEQPALSFELNPATGEYRLIENGYAKVLHD